MKIELQNISIKDLVKGYVNNDEEGVSGFNGKLNIRPKYQREFIYDDKKRNAVISTVMKNFPLNVMYWAKNQDESFEVLDGQQRTISICEYLVGNFSYDKKFFFNLQKDEQEKILNYKLFIYFCEGEPKEKLDWFEIINIAGAELYPQELKNAIYSGTWLTDAKRYFSKTQCVAYKIANNYLKGTPIRQDYLETVIKWISNDKIRDYMSINQNKPQANDLWLYFNSVIEWVKIIFIKYRKEMKGVDFGFLYNEFKNKEFNSDKIEKEIAKLMEDEDVTKKSGIYYYVLNRKQKHLNIRAFSDKQKREVYERQKGICKECKKYFEINEMEADHIKPWHEGGKTITENCQMLCKEDNRRKSGK